MRDRPEYKSVPNYRKYEMYHDEALYVKGWNDAMKYIFGEDDKNDKGKERRDRKQSHLCVCK